MMRTLLLVGTFAMLIAAPAWACRGTAEYPQVIAQLQQSNLPSADKEALAKRLQEGEAIHRRGHDLNDQALRQESLKILDEIKVKIAQ
ncbi:MAG TPA: hypothetical protein VNK52_03055 [Hyphomicrobiaceae bacterium]|nr:hypothetical protein [Hyphomicrobiaceae bacterium]